MKKPKIDTAVPDSDQKPGAAVRDDPSPAHLKWLVASRTANQTIALTLFELLTDYPETVKDKEYSPIVQRLVSACFSLWRAAFLADKDVTRSKVVEAARSFLGKMLVDNAITYPQDRNARSWTFNYYMNNATADLLYLSKKWPEIDVVLNRKMKVIKGQTSPQRRWDRTQSALEVAVKCLGDNIL